jgi:hypothetical protein
MSSRLHELKANRLTDEVLSYEVHIWDVSSGSITDENGHREAKEALEQAKHERDRNEVLLGRAIDADAKEGDAFAKLARYERSLERSPLRTLDELRQQQHRCRNRRSPPIFDAVTLAAGDAE